MLFWDAMHLVVAALIMLKQIVYIVDENHRFKNLACVLSFVAMFLLKIVLDYMHGLDDSSEHRAVPPACSYLHYAKFLVLGYS